MDGQRRVGAEDEISEGRRTRDVPATAHAAGILDVVGVTLPTSCALVSSKFFMQTKIPH